MDTMWIIFLLMIGACVGSFLNVVIYRVPRGDSIVFPGSHCPNCGKPIRWYDNVPIFSWLLLRARCRNCKVRISPRYIIIEAVTGGLVVGLYVAYFMLRSRQGGGEFTDSWPMFTAHAALICGLLVCSAVDIEHWIVPLEVCWIISLLGVIIATAAPHPWMPTVSPTTGAAGLAGAVGLAISILLQHMGVLQQSFLDSEEKPIGPAQPADDPKTSSGKGKPSKAKSAKSDRAKAERVVAVAITSASGVNPRKEVLREVLFLAPAIALAIAAAMLVSRVPAVGDAWRYLTNPKAGLVGGKFAPHFNGFLAAVFGYLIGGLCVWATRILATLGFGKEAMGLGDVHLMAAVGAVTGWIIPSVAFFVAPVFGLLWAIYLWAGRNQRELPYGPWLAAATITVMIFYDTFRAFLEPYAMLAK